MKKVLLLSLTIFIVSSLSAQFYAGLGLGYGMGANKRVVGTETTANSETNLYGSFAQGVNIAGKLGFMFNENMGFELGVDYFMGSKITMNEWTTGIQEGQTSGLILLPQFVLKTESGVYSRVGLYIPVSGKTIITSSDSDFMGDGSGVAMEMEGESQGSFSLGLVGAIGYNYAISDKMDLFAEIQYNALSMKSGTFKYTTFTVGGADQLANMDTYSTEVEYVDELNASSNNGRYNTNVDRDSPKEELKKTSPFSSVGINVGVVMKF